MTSKKSDETLLSAEDQHRLLVYLTTQRELNEFEAANIIKAMNWADKSRSLRKDLLSYSGLCQLHRKMFNDTWEWAGELRKTMTNIGVAPSNIQSEIANLLGDLKYWLDHKTYPLEEIAIRFHHRLVWIHPFPNGNGRWARLATDLFLKHQGVQRFSWGSASLVKDSDQKKAYVSALRRMDKDRDDIAALMTFASS